MVTASKVGPQDLPPSGGYAPIQTERIKLRRFVGFKFGVAAFVISFSIGYPLYVRNYRRLKKELIEMRSARFAMTPLLVAERDRALLKQLRKNRDEEEDLMKDYPGWEVGTYFGEPVFHNVPEDGFVMPQFNEFVAHAPSEGSSFIRHCQHLLV